LLFLALFWPAVEVAAAFFLLADPRPVSPCWLEATFGSALTPSSFMKSAHSDEDAAAPVESSAAAPSSASPPPRDLNPRPRTLIISSTAPGGKFTFPELSWTESLSMSFLVPNPGATIGSWSRTRADRRVANGFFRAPGPSPEVEANSAVVLVGGEDASETVEREGGARGGVETAVEPDPSSSFISNNGGCLALSASPQQQSDYSTSSRQSCSTVEEHWEKISCMATYDVQTIQHHCQCDMVSDTQERSTAANYPCFYGALRQASCVSRRGHRRRITRFATPPPSSSSKTGD
jgi:hypothetical protein